MIKKAVLLLGVVSILGSGIISCGEVGTEKISEPVGETVEKITKDDYFKVVPLEESRKVHSNFVAVNEEGQGAIGSLVVEAREGDGKVLVDVEELFFWLDVQNSIRIARKVALDYSGLAGERIDLIYSMKIGGKIIEGESAGAAFTVATIAALRNKNLREDVIITGKVTEEGLIGKVGSILEKAEAAKRAGFSLFLVPPGQSQGIQYKSESIKRKVGPMEIIETKTYPIEINIEEEVGIRITEVSNIGEAVRFFGLD